jgi:3-deoxy-D-manno-octulosonic-acid transferase
LPNGSQNLIEPCAVGRPVIIGPSTYNFEEAADQAIAAGAALRVANAAQAIGAAAEISKDALRRERMGNDARVFVEAHRGAVDRLLRWLDTTLG